MKFFRPLILALAILAALPANMAVATATSPLRVFVSILPQIEIVERIGGERVQVEAIVQPGHNPHTYELTPRQLTRLSDAHVYFSIGVNFENGVIPRLKSIVPNLPIIDTRKGIKLRSITDRSMIVPEHLPSDDYGHSHKQHDHEHGRSDPVGAEKHIHNDDCDHHPESADPHIWLSPTLIAIQARTICDALIALDPAGREDYELNLEELTRQLNRLDSELKAMFSDLPSRKFMVYHPSWGYFADAYDLEQVAIEQDGKSPPARQLARTIDQAKAAEIKVIFTQPQFSKKSADLIAEQINGTVVSIDPLAKDFFANLRAAAAAIRKGISP